MSIGSEYNKENISPDASSNASVSAILLHQANSAAATPSRLLHSLQEQVRVLRRAAEILVKQSNSKESTPPAAGSANDGSFSEKDRDTYESDVAELQEQIVKLKGNVATPKILRPHIFIFCKWGFLFHFQPFCRPNENRLPLFDQSSRLTNRRPKWRWPTSRPSTKRRRRS